MFRTGQSRILSTTVSRRAYVLRLLAGSRMAVARGT